ncbi:hypothetical protein CEQ28_010235 [Hafnia alvei]|nr:hypothetical protein CEQ28_010235 [Hafnia alvei]
MIMWFENAHGKEKIAYMFNNELSLSEIELDKFIFHDISRLTLGFNIKNLPSLTPEKWKKNKFNTLALTLTFTEVSTLKFDGQKIGFECTPVIDAIENNTRLIINNKNLNFLCIAKFMFIDSIVPYLDNRWSK